MNRLKYVKSLLWSLGFCLFAATGAMAGEADLAIPDLRKGTFPGLGGIMSQRFAERHL